MRFCKSRRCAAVLLSVTLLAMCILPTGAEEQPATEPTSKPASKPTSKPTSKPAEPDGPKKVPLSFKNAPMDQIAKFLAEHLGKPVITAKDLEKTKVSVTFTEKLPLPEALEILETALHEAGATIETRDKAVHLIPIAQVRQSQIPSVAADAHYGVQRH